jgi:hypothetical protein
MARNATFGAANRIASVNSISSSLGQINL